MTLTFQDARAGRTFRNAFECWGNPEVGSAVGTFNPGYQLSPDLSCGQETVGIAAGSTLAQALTSVDLLIVNLGTNDQSFALGQIGDTSSAGTYYGNVRWVVETLLSARPSLRLVLVTLQYNGFASADRSQQVANATEVYGQSIGVPVINMFKKGGVNSISSSVLTRDGTHPSDFGFQNFYGPVIAQSV